MKLSEWIAREGLPVKRVAEMCGVQRTSVVNAAAGVPLQTFKLAARLVAFTGGEVTLEDLADPDGEVRRQIAAEVVPWQRLCLDHDREQSAPAAQDAEQPALES
jgi:hypothetical protein